MNAHGNSDKEVSCNVAMSHSQDSMSKENNIDQSAKTISNISNDATKAISNSLQTTLVISLSPSPAN